MVVFDTIRGVCRLLTGVLLLLSSAALYSQQEAFYSLYRYNMQVINPGYAGAEAAHQLSVLSRRQWSQFEDAPSTLAFAYSSARANNVGLGVSVVSDQVFVEQQTFAYVDFSYRLTLGGDAALYLGLKGGGNFYRSDPTPLTTYDPVSDPIQLQRNRFIPNMGAGAYFVGSRYWFSFSIPRLFGVSRGAEDINTAKDRPHVYGSAGGQFALGSRLMFKPSVMLRKVSGNPLTSEITGMVSWQNTFEMGVSARSNSSFSLLSFINISGIQLGYAYETPRSNQLAGLGLKTHELILRFQFGESETTPAEGENLPTDE